MKPKIPSLLVAMLSFVIFSCHKKYDDNQGSSSLKVKIIGTWDEQAVYTSLYKNGNLQERDTVLNEDGDYTKVEFKSDQTVAGTSSTGGQIEQTAGSYSLQGTKLALILEDPESGKKDTTLVNCQIDNKTMIWEEDATVSSSSSGQTAKVETQIYFTKE